MSSSSYFGLIILFFVAATFSVSSAAKFKQPEPTALLFPIRKDMKTLQYYTTLGISKPDNYVELVINLGGQHTWFSCDAYQLPTYRPIICGSRKCKKYRGDGCMHCPSTRTPGCTKDACVVYSYNAFQGLQGVFALGLGEDALYVESTNGLSVGLSYQSPQPFPFTCAVSDLLKGLSNETKGMVGLANLTTSLPAQMSTQFKLPYKFALCIPSNSEYTLGHMFIGGGPYFFLPYSKDIAKELITAQLVINPISTTPVYTTGDPSDEYFIDVKSISVDDKPVAINASLLSINEEGHGGTKFSTITPFTKLETSIYISLVNAFSKAAALRKMKNVAPVAPFGACFEAKNIAKSQTGPVVPSIDIGLAGNKFWRFYGANSMVSVSKEVACLAFVDGGSYPRTSVVIGGHQMEDHLLEFDLVSSTVGISTSLLTRNTTCTQSRVI